MHFRNHSWRLRYEGILYFVPLYPGTLTYSSALPTIGLSDNAKSTMLQGRGKQRLTDRSF